MCLSIRKTAWVCGINKGKIITALRHELRRCDFLFCKGLKVKEGVFQEIAEDDGELVVSDLGHIEEKVGVESHKRGGEDGAGDACAAGVALLGAETTHEAVLDVLFPLVGKAGVTVLAQQGAECVGVLFNKTDGVVGFVQRLTRQHLRHIAVVEIEADLPKACQQIVLHRFQHLELIVEVEVEGGTGNAAGFAETVDGDDNYDGATESATFVVNKVAPVVAVVNVTAVVAGHDVVINVTGPADRVGQVVVSVGGVDYFANMTGGKANVTVSGLAADNNTVGVVYLENDKYVEATASGWVNVTGLLP